MKLEAIAVSRPDDANVILGQSHFIKTIEDIHELMVTSVPGVKFGLAFNEASGPCLVRHSGTDAELEQLAVKNSQAIGAGHSFTLIMRGAYPINVLTQLKALSEVCSIFCATANPVSVIVYRASAAMLIIMAIWTSLTGARTSIIPIKICPYIKGGSYPGGGPG